MTTTPSAHPRVVAPPDLLDVLAAHTGVSHDAFTGQENVALENLGVDSLATLELQAVLLERFGVEIPDEAATMSLDELVRFVNARLAGGE